MHWIYKYIQLRGPYLLHDLTIHSDLASVGRQYYKYLRLFIKYSLDELATIKSGASGLSIYI